MFIFSKGEKRVYRRNIVVALPSSCPQSRRNNWRYWGGRLSVLIVLLGLWVTPALAETWSDTTGQFKVEASFLGIRGSDVYLKKTNGTMLKVPLNRLSAESQQLARQLAAGPVMPATPAGGAGDTATAEAAVRAFTQQLEQGNAHAVWDALPPRYQSDVNDVVHTFAENMDAQLWSVGVGIFQKAVRVLKDKKPFILGHPALQENPVDDATMNANWDGLVGIFDLIVASELADLDKLKAVDVGQFLNGTGKQIMEKMTALAEAVDQSGVNVEDFPGMQVDAMPFAQLSQMQISTISSDGDTAVLKFVTPDGEGGQKEEEVKFVLVDDKWLPGELVTDWDEGMVQIKQALTGMPQQLQANKQKAMMPMMMVGGVLDQLLAAQTQEDFNKVIDGITQMFMPDMGDMEGMDEGEAPIGLGAPDN